jgi:polyphosphate:AMP phosphotransferase
MFEAVELSREVSKSQYKEEVPQLQTALLEAQRAIREAGVPVIVIVAGVEGAGKGEVVNLLNKWLDTRGLETHAFWNQTDEERQRPAHWRFWRRMPARGRMAIMFGSWYTQPIMDRVFEEIDEEAFDNRLRHIATLERLLTDDGQLLVKLWFHLAKDEQKRRAKAQKKQPELLHLSPFLGKFRKKYDQFLVASQRTIRLTDAGHAPWHLIESTDDRYRDLATGNILLQAMQRHLSENHAEPVSANEDNPAIEIPAGDQKTILDHVDLSQKLSDADYETQLAEAQQELNQLVWKCWKKKRTAVVVFEGWDAAGKGGVIRRVTAALDARVTQVIPIAAPTEIEKAHHYLWRFWQHLPRDGKLIIFDRSWYGRVLVERVEGFANRVDWMRAYREINEFEEQIESHGGILAKFWLHISEEEQLRRFQDREQTPWKQYKITPDDWRNREKRDEYKSTVNEMVERTSTEYAPWHLVPGEDKHFGRVFVLKTLCDRLKSALE